MWFVMFWKQVPNQTTETALAAIKTHLIKESSKIPGVELTIQEFDSTAEPFRVARDAPGNIITRSVLRSLYGSDPVYTWSGTSIAALTLLQQVLSIDTTVLSFGLPNENIHAPNEFTRLEELRLAERAYTLLLTELGSKWELVTSASKDELWVDRVWNWYGRSVCWASDAIAISALQQSLFGFTFNMQH